MVYPGKHFSIRMMNIETHIPQPVLFIFKTRENITAGDRGKNTLAETTKYSRHEWLMWKQ
ncbi:hypothetical protein A9B99_20570 [Mangrovibacter phragmitis]|uniref:Uncharacterized protein n=1 Tax=Mangrovibacter phragmitis TaxID=1691903 RepID=A0A1B7L5K4_9ENTR|nr:hypothetical protein A9B99_20570 [Mangrovibacter phragmitis]